MSSVCIGLFELFDWSFQIMQMNYIAIPLERFFDLDTGGRKPSCHTDIRNFFSVRVINLIEVLDRKLWSTSINSFKKHLQQVHDTKTRFFMDWRLLSLWSSYSSFVDRCACDRTWRVTWWVFIARQHTAADARYWYSNSVRPSVRLSVCPWHAGIVWKRLNVSS